MTDKLLSVAISAAILGALALWVPTLHLCERFVGKCRKRREPNQSSVSQTDKPQESITI